MALKIGDYYTVKVQNEVLYNNSGTADIKDTTTYAIGYLNKGDRHRIINVLYGTGNGSPNQTDGPGKTPLYGIMNTTGAYAIGWVRDEESSVTGVRIYGLPSSITAESTGFRVNLEGTVGVAFTITAKIGTTTIYTANGNMGYPTAYWNLSFDATARSKMVSALGSSSSKAMTVTVVSKYNGSTIRSSEASTTVTAPPRAVAGPPTWSKNPVISFENATGNKVYENQTTIKVSFSPSDLIFASGARYYTSYIKIGENTKYSTTSYSTIPTKAGSLNIAVGVSDTNGKWVYYNAYITVEKAPAISIATFTAHRSGSTGARLVASGKFTPATETPSGTSLTYKIEKKVRGTTSWSSVVDNQTPTTSGDTWSFTLNQSSGFTGSSSYDLRLTVSGALSSAIGNSVIGTEAVPMSWGKHGVSAGIIFDNNNSASFQVGSGGISSEGGYISQKIPANSNLDSYTKPGWYHSPLNVYAKTITNTPSDMAFSLFVTNHAGVAQFFTEHGTGNTTRGTYHRNSYNGTWSTWKKMATTDDIPDLTNLNAATLSGKTVKDIVNEAVSKSNISVPTYGTSTNRYWKVGNLLICASKITLSSGGTYNYSTSWDFPVAFASASEIFTSASVRTSGSTTKFVNWNGNATMFNHKVTGVDIWWAGTHDTKALSGTVFLDCIAIGRWV